MKLNALVQRHAERRASLAPEIVGLYVKERIGHKTIAARMGISPRIFRTILQEQGVYIPGALFQGAVHKAAVRKKRRAASKADIADEIKRRKNNRRRGVMIELPLFAYGAKCKVPKPTVESKAITATKFREKYNTDIVFRLLHVLRKRLNKVARRGRGYSGDNLAWIGCSPVEMLRHIESQFSEGMSWDNYGSWHIDHITPCARFDMTCRVDRDACFHWSNLQPLWAMDNFIKGDRIGSSRGRWLRRGAK